MSHVLLLGAGFTNNWHGWLAGEVLEYLLTYRPIRDDAELRTILMQYQASGGFESALEHVQERHRHDPNAYARHLEAIQGGVEQMFADMNGALFERNGFEFQNFEPMVRTLLTRFDAIFTLNQDILLEHFYKDQYNVALTQGSRWNGIQIPGMRRIPPSEALYGDSWAHATWVTQPDGEYKVEPRCQPYFKLHGSSNWRNVEGGTLLVIGGEKVEQIKLHSVLATYARAFEDYLLRGGTKLMVIGYGFRDTHINRTIVRGVNERALTFFVVAPAGAKLAETLNMTRRPGNILVKTELEDVFERGLIGASSRPLNSTFGGDNAEFRKLNHFFDT